MSSTTNGFHSFEKDAENHWTNGFSDSLNGITNGHQHTNGYTNGYGQNGHTNGHDQNGHTNGHDQNGHTNGYEKNGHDKNGHMNGHSNGINGICNGKSNGHHLTPEEEEEEDDQLEEDSYNVLYRLVEEKTPPPSPKASRIRSIPKKSVSSESAKERARKASRDLKREQNDTSGGGRRSLKREHLIIKWILRVTHAYKDSSIDFADWIADGAILSR